MLGHVLFVVEGFQCALVFQAHPLGRARMRRGSRRVWGETDSRVVSDEKNTSFWFTGLVGLEDIMVAWSHD